MIRSLLITFALLSILGCDSQKTWTAVESERRRVFTEGKTLVPKDQWDSFEIIVFDRPRTKPESIVTGYQHAITRINRERIDYAEDVERCRQTELAIAENRLVPAYEGPEILARMRSRLADRADRLRNAQRLLLVAEAAQCADDWMPVLDILVHNQLPLNANLSPRALGPSSDHLRLRRATDWFGSWASRFREVQP